MDIIIVMLNAYSFFFFFQAEDGIRDLTVTGVQTCALPISRAHRARAAERYALPGRHGAAARRRAARGERGPRARPDPRRVRPSAPGARSPRGPARHRARRRPAARGDRRPDRRRGPARRGAAPGAARDARRRQPARAGVGCARGSRQRTPRGPRVTSRAGPVLVAALMLLVSVATAADVRQWSWLGVRIRDLSE